MVTGLPSSLTRFITGPAAALDSVEFIVNWALFAPWGLIVTSPGLIVVGPALALNVEIPAILIFPPKVDTPDTFRVWTSGFCTVDTVTDAIPAAPEVATTDTPPPIKSSVAILPAVPTTTPSSLTVKPPIAPTPPAVIPVRAEPSPAKAGALTTDPLKVNVELSWSSPLFPA